MRLGISRSPDRLRENSAFLARVWSMMSRILSGLESEQKNGQVPTNAVEVDSPEDMIRVAEKAQLAKHDYVWMIQDYMELGVAVEIERQKKSELYIVRATVTDG